MRLSRLLFLAALSFPLVANRAVGEDDPALTAARARQQAAQSVSVEYRVKDVIAKGGYIPNAHKSTPPVPPDETTFESSNRLIIDDSKYRFEHNHFITYSLGGKLNQIRFVNVSNGTVAKFMAPDGLDNSGKAGCCAIQIPEHARNFDTAELLPILMTFRAVNEEFARYSVPEWKPTGETVVIDGTTCREYAVPTPDRSTTKYWLDPSGDYVVRRLRREWDGRLTDQQDVTYRKHESGSWVPETWVHQRYSAVGDVVRSSRTDVTALRLNEPQPAERFDLAFPVGASIQDSSDPRNIKHFFVEADGSLRQMTSAELNPSKPKPRFSRRQWWFIGSWLAVGVGLFVYVSVRLRMSRASRKLGTQA
jgi:hypothetical protein